MTLNDFANYLDNMATRLRRDAPDIIAETATEYYEERFNEKEFDGQAWEPAKKEKRTGSLLVESTNLQKSFNNIVSENEVIIQAGNSKVGYAKVHNEGFKGPITIPAHTRNGKSVAAHTRQMDMPQRQFMGEARELNNEIRSRLEGFLKAFF